MDGWLLNVGPVFAGLTEPIACMCDSLGGTGGPCGEETVCDGELWVVCCNGEVDLSSKDRVRFVPELTTAVMADDELPLVTDCGLPVMGAEVIDRSVGEVAGGELEDVGEFFRQHPEMLLKLSIKGLLLRWSTVLEHW